MRCRSNVLLRPQPINGSPPHPRRIELYAGRGRKRKRLGNAGRDTLSQWRPRRKVHPGIRAQTGTQFPDDASSGNCDPESSRRVGYAFPMAAQAESASRNLSSEWDSFSRWRAQRKMRPGICSENGTRFPADRSALLNSKTCALAIPKLGRRKPKRNRRRSI